MTAVAVVFFLPLPAASEAAAPQRISDSIVQIGIVQKAHSLRLRAHGKFQVVDQKTGETHDLRHREVYPIEARPGTLHFGPFLFLGPARLLPKAPEDFVELGSARYHGSLLVRPNPDSTLTVVQETGIEEYLYGVLPKEMSPDWPEEALKAQAVVARTFTLGNLGKFERSGFDLSVDERSQVYAGLDAHDERASRAVRATDAEALHYQGELLRAFFHSCCGGATTSSSQVWGGDPAQRPDRGVRDRWCHASPHTSWTAYLPFDRILDALNRNGKTATRLKGIGRGKEDSTGRLRTLKFFTDGGDFVVRANDFRRWTGSGDLKSTRITRITRRRSGYAFAGKGFGHGAGLCQWGAKAMAEKGKTYRQILEHYFPGAELRKRED